MRILVQSTTYVTSKLRVKSAGKDRNRPPIGVIGGVVDELVIECQRQHLVDGIGVIGLNNLFGAIIKSAVTNQDAESAGSDKFAVVCGKCVDRSSNSDGIIRPSPGLAPDRDAPGQAGVDVGESHDLILTVVPAPAPEYPDLASYRLLNVEHIAIFDPSLPRQRDVGIIRRRDRLGESLGI